MELKDILMQILYNQNTMLEYIFGGEKDRVQKDMKRTEDMLSELRNSDNFISLKGE